MGQLWSFYVIDCNLALKFKHQAYVFTYSCWKKTIVHLQAFTPTAFRPTLKIQAYVFLSMPIVRQAGTCCTEIPRRYRDERKIPISFEWKLAKGKEITQLSLKSGTWNQVLKYFICVSRSVCITNVRQHVPVVKLPLPADIDHIMEVVPIVPIVPIVSKCLVCDFGLDVHLFQTQLYYRRVRPTVAKQKHTAQKHKILPLVSH